MISTIKLYKNGEELVDSTRGDCPKCKKGYLLIDLEKSFIAVIGNNKFSFDVVSCNDLCGYTHLEKLVSPGRKIQITSDKGE
jgi:ribosomal protein S27AE